MTVAYMEFIKEKVSETQLFAELERYVSLSHPNVLMAIGTVLEKEETNIVTEFCPKTLRSWLKEHQQQQSEPISSPQQQTLSLQSQLSEPSTTSTSIHAFLRDPIRWSLAMDVCRAIAYLHSLSILHLDLKRFAL